MLNTKVITIPHDQHRYETVGDWERKPDGSKLFEISDMGNSDYEFLVGIHEQIEEYLCEKRGITEDEVNAFDIEYEKNRLEGDTSEPGDAVGAPYRKEHFFATSIERLIAAELGVDWETYDTEIGEL